MPNLDYPLCGAGYKYIRNKCVPLYIVHRGIMRCKCIQISEQKEQLFGGVLSFQQICISLSNHNKYDIFAMSHTSSILIIKQPLFFVGYCFFCEYEKISRYKKMRK